MSDLETEIRRLAKSGRLNHISLAFDNAAGWNASYRGVADADKGLAHHDDPVSALLMALTGKKLAPTPKPKRAPPKPAPVATPVFDDEDLL